MAKLNKYPQAGIIDQTGHTGLDLTRLSGLHQTGLARPDQSGLAGLARPDQTGVAGLDWTGLDRTRLAGLDQTGLAGLHRTGQHLTRLAGLAGLD